MHPRSRFRQFVPAALAALLPCMPDPAPGAVNLVINEFMADNDAALADPQGEYDDWIEIHNPGTATIDLGGMYLTDDLSDAAGWRFPSPTYLGAGGYLLVWADGDVLDYPDGLHADFQLAAGGEEVGLYAADGVTLVDSVSFGAQSADVSYGRFPDAVGPWHTLNEPTPNGANAAATAEEVYFSRLGGVITNSFVLKLSTRSDTARIRFTIDGSVPTASSYLYGASGINIHTSASRRIRARAFQDGLAPGPVRTEAYLAVSPALQSFNSNLPILLIETFGQALPASWWADDMVNHPDPIATYATFIETNRVTGRAAVTDLPDFAGRAGVRERGQSTTGLDKKPYKLETWGEADEDRDVSLLGLPSDADWVMHNPHTDKTFMRNVLVYGWSNRMGHYASRTRFMEVFINQDGGQIGGPESTGYAGIYILMEAIKRGGDRVDIEALRPADTAEPEITGGYILRHDKNRDEDTFSTWAGQFYYVEPAHDEITTPQKNYIRNYIEAFEAVHRGSGFADPVNGYAKYIDVESFIDHDICAEVTREVDVYRFSTYVSKDRGGKLVMAPEWDFNWSMGNNDYSAVGVQFHHAEGWHHDETGGVESNWHDRLKDDPEYLLNYADRWFHLRESVLSDASVDTTIDTHYALLNAEAAGRNFARWDILNAFVGFDWGWGAVPNFYYGGNPAIPCHVQDHTYGMQVEWLKNWLTGNGTPAGSCAATAYAPPYADRLGWIDEHMGDMAGAAAPPRLFVNGAPADAGATVSVPATLTMAAEGDTIYYTLDGTDPREAFTGNAVGTAYAGVIPLNATVDVRARTKVGAGWSAMNRAVFADGRPLNSLRITEIMYHPQHPGEEFIELQNTGASAISLNLCTFTDGVRFTFPDMVLAPGQHVVVVEDQAAFEARYGTGHTVAGAFGPESSLENRGEEIVLRDAAGTEIHDFDYRDWYPVTDGRGFSLCVADPCENDLEAWGRKENWQASSGFGGSPGGTNPTPAVARDAIVINELLTHTDDPGGDWIELHNTTGAPIDIGGWFLSDDLDDLLKYEVAPGTSIGGGGYAVFTQEDHFGVTSTDPGRRTGFGLSELGDAVFLSSGSGGDLAGGYSVTAGFGAAANGVTFGRHLKGDGPDPDVDVVSTAWPTMGSGNAPPRVPAVVIKEIMYNPSRDRDETSEYLELFNRSSRTVDLYDPAHPSNTWKFTRGIDYTFPPGVSIPPGAHLLVVRTDPDLFRYIHDIPLARPVYGPYAGALDNDGEKLELSMPGAPEPGHVPYLRLEQVHYSDGSHPPGHDPWPPEADGTTGYSLHRVAAGAYGNDVDNWQAAAPTPVSPDVPVIGIQRTGDRTFLTWEAEGVLQTAPYVQGPWSNLTGAGSPFELMPGSKLQGYFRVEDTAPP